MPVSARQWDALSPFTSLGQGSCRGSDTKERQEWGRIYKKVMKWGGKIAQELERRARGMHKIRPVTPGKTGSGGPGYLVGEWQATDTTWTSGVGQRALCNECSPSYGFQKALHILFQGICEYLFYSWGNGYLCNMLTSLTGEIEFHYLLM